jgi:hypothetical protein
MLGPAQALDEQHVGAERRGHPQWLAYLRSAA